LPDVNRDGVFDGRSKESASQAGDEHSSDSRESSAARWPGRPTSPTVHRLDARHVINKLFVQR
jgi:hypothetical protein